MVPAHLPARLVDWLGQGRAAILLLVALMATPGAAQTSAPPAGSVPPFLIQSDNGDNRLRIGALAQIDARVPVDGLDRSAVQTFTTRRLRGILDGRAGRHIEFFLNVDAVGGTATIFDGYFDTVVSPAFRVRLGKARVPFSYDRSILVAQMLFIERGLVATVSPNRDTGVQVMGDLAQGRLTYQSSLTNGVIDGGRSDTDTGSATHVAGKVTVRPWVSQPGHALAGLSLLLAADTGMQGTQLPAFNSHGQQTIFRYARAEADGRRTRWSPMAAYNRGPFWGWIEFVRSAGGVRPVSGTRTVVGHEAFEVAGSWVLTGEAAPERNPRPSVNFDPPSGHLGAWQIAARYETLSVDEAAARSGVAAAGSSLTMRSATAAVNWYLNPYLKYEFDLVRTTFARHVGPPRPAETLVLVRGQLAF
jgi:phosphate-selective porin OprO/OprP